MTLEQVEVQIADLITKARKFQLKAQQFQRQGAMVALQSEVAAREKFNEYFEDGLMLLSKSIIKGRKIKESLVAQAHRKSASLKKAEFSFLNTDDEPTAKIKTPHSKFMKAAENIKRLRPSGDKVGIKKMKSKNKHGNTSLSTSRAR